MIVELAIENYKSIRDRMVVSFAASKTTKLSGNLLQQTNRERFVKAMALYGANASGKTTVLDALCALYELVLFSSQDQKPTERIPRFEAFALDKACAKLPSTISLTIDLDGNRYAFSVSASSDRVWQETLHVKAVTKSPSRKSKSHTLISRVWNRRAKLYDIQLSEELGPPTTIAAAQEQTPPNRLMLGKLASLNSELASSILEWFDEDLGFYDMYRNPFAERVTLGETAKLLKKGGAFAELVTSFVCDADIGIRRMQVFDLKTVEPQPTESDQNPEMKIVSRPGLLFHHLTEDGIDQAFRARSESSGTLRFVALLTAILKPGNRRRLVCVDELSASLHPDLVQRLLGIVHSSEYNPNGNQLFFTTHDSHLINPDHLLRRDQVTICEKDRYGRSSTVRLDSFHDGARSDANLQKQYLQGRFGGIPQFGPKLEDVPVDDKPLEIKA